jgi:hypothetical protein
VSSQRGVNVACISLLDRNNSRQFRGWPPGITLARRTCLAPPRCFKVPRILVGIVFRRSRLWK